MMTFIALLVAAPVFTALGFVFASFLHEAGEIDPYPFHEYPETEESACPRTD